MKFGLKISRPGRSTDSTDPQHFVFNSELGSIKVQTEPPDKLPVDVVAAGSSFATLTVPHGLAFIPIAMLYAERTPSSGRYYFGSCYPGPEDRTTPVTVEGGNANTYTDITNLIVKFLNNKSSSQTIKAYYFIFGDSAS